MFGTTNSGSFFHDPVTGLWYHQTVDMVERRCCAGLHAGAERLSPPMASTGMFKLPICAKRA
jgi:hypothetical protein